MKGKRPHVIPVWPVSKDIEQRELKELEVVKMEEGREKYKSISENINLK